MPPSEPFNLIFERLREILKNHAGHFSVVPDLADHYGLQAPVGPATLQAWRGKMKSPKIPVAWVRISKAYVSFHLMGVYGNPKLLGTCSRELLAHMQGKSCFNFKKIEKPLFEELERLTAQSLAVMLKAGYISEN